MSENFPEDWRQMSKGRRAVTHTDEHRANNTPVRNQFQELTDHQEDPTPSLAPRELIVEFSRLSPAIELQTEEEIPATDPSDSSSSSSSNNNDESSEDNNSDIPEEASDTGSLGSIESFDTMTSITSDYTSLLETIRLVSAEQATVFSGKKKNYTERHGRQVHDLKGTSVELHRKEIQFK
jgi:hypothetical protein